jgi:hypothetical protein
MISGKDTRSLTFDAAEGQNLALLITTDEGAAEVRIRMGRFDEIIEPAYVAAGAQLVRFGIDQAGTYQAEIEPQAQPFTASVELIAVDPPIALAADLKGAAGSFRGSTPGQDVHLKATLTAGDRISIDFSDVRDSLKGTLISPSGRMEAESIYIASDVFLEPFEVAETGEYTLIMRQESVRPPSGTFRMYLVPPDFTAGLAFRSPRQVAVEVPGQRAVLTFSGPPEGRVIFRFRSLSVGSNIDLLGPSEENIVSRQYVDQGDSFVGPFTTAANRPHNLVLDGSGALTPRGEITVIPVPADLQRTPTVDGPATAVSVVIGQRALIAFEAEGGQSLEVQFAAVSLAGTFLLLDADGKEVMPEEYVGPGEGRFPLAGITRDGKYTLVFFGNEQPVTANVSIRTAAP